MNLIQNPTVISPAEAVVIRISERASETLTALKATTVASFHDFWDDLDTVADKLEVMGTNAVASFQQHDIAGHQFDPGVKRGAVPGGEVIHHPHPMTGAQQRLGEVKADKSGAAGDKDVHGSTSFFIPFPRPR